MSIFSDGCRSMVKGLEFLKESLGSVRLTGTDPCHTIRIATGQPVQHEADFMEFWSDAAG